MTYASEVASDAELKDVLGSAGEPKARTIDVALHSEQLLQAYLTATPSGARSAGESGGAEAPQAEGTRRRKEFLRERQFARFLHDVLYNNSRTAFAPGECDALKSLLGIDLLAEDCKFEVHAVRPTVRVYPDGRTKPELLVLITQRRHESLSGENPAGAEALHYKFRGGCTLLIDPLSGETRYVIRKHIQAPGRQQRQEQFLRERLTVEGLHARALYGVRRGSERPVRQEPFRSLHRRQEEEQWS
jgi:hypothetical protein